MRSALPVVACLGLGSGCMVEPPYGSALSSDEGRVPTQHTSDACPAFHLEPLQHLGARQLIGEAGLLEAHSVVHHGPGLALYDDDGDGDLDLAIATELGDTLVLANDGEGLFDEVLDAFPHASVVATGDVDGDGRTDLFLGSSAGLPDLLILDDGSKELHYLADSDGLTTGGAFFDVDRDGVLELAITRHTDALDPDTVSSGHLAGGPNVVLRLHGTQYREDPTLIPEDLRDATGFQALPLDVDQDGLLDLYQVNDFGWLTHPNQLLFGNPEGGLDAPTDTGAELATATMGVSAGDIDGDGVLDLWLSDAGSPDLLLGDGQGGFYDGTRALGAWVPHDELHESSWGTEVADLDLDGRPELLAVYGPFGFAGLGEEQPGGGLYEDIFSTEGQALTDPDAQRDVLLHQLPDGTFEDLSAEAGFDSAAIGRSVMAVDLDGDGVLEVLRGGWTHRNEPYFDSFRVVGGCGRGLTVRLEGGAHHQGAVLDAVMGTREVHRQPVMGRAFGSAPLATTFALGEHEVVSELTITLPDGRQLTYEDLGPGELVVPADPG